jgi:DNA-binding Lrp family transcriptional regulator
VPVQGQKGIVVMQFDAVDKKLLSMIQRDFPLVPEPYRELGVALGVPEEEVLARLQALMESGVIRRLGGVFDSRKLGYSGALCAMNVDKERIREVAGVVNSFTGVTHNYLREGFFNMWFTVLAPTGAKLGEILDEIRERTGIREILTLPSENIFKIRVNFDLD